MTAGESWRKIGRVALSVCWLALTALLVPGIPLAEAPPTRPVPPPIQELAAAVQPTAPSGPVTPVAPDTPPTPATVAPSAGASAPQETDRTSAAPPAEATAGAPKPAGRDGAVAQAAASGAVTIEDFSFAPATITVNAGDSVTWRNDGPTAHTATADDGSFDTGLLSKGESRTIGFDEAGTFSYLCQPHPSMKGTVRVVAQSSGVDDGGGSAGTGTTAGTGSTTTDSVAADAATLPNTGSSPLWLVVTGLGLLAIGGSGLLRRGHNTRS